MKSLSIELIDINRFKKIKNQDEKRFLDEGFTELELNLCAGSIESLAARYAAKKAIIKATRLSEDKAIKNQIEIINAESGSPIVRTNEYIKEICRTRNINNILLSLSHTKEYALAICYVN